MLGIARGDNRGAINKRSNRFSAQKFPDEVKFQRKKAAVNHTNSVENGFTIIVDPFARSSVTALAARLFGAGAVIERIVRAANWFRQ